MTWEVRLGDCLDVMAAMPEASVDAVVTDPPYGIRFMGKAWDGADIAAAAGARATAGNHRTSGNPETPRSRGAREAGTYDLSLTANQGFQDWCRSWGTACLRVLKPGGHLLAFGGTRTYHRLSCGLEDAGFEIRDCLVWLYGSGFPKSLNVGDGWGTALKPAHEPVVLARKPLAGTVATNVLEHGTGALNIGGCRIDGVGAEAGHTRHGGGIPGNGTSYELSDSNSEMPAGRWPANVILDPDAARMLDEQSGPSTSRIGQPRAGTNGNGWGMTATGAEYADTGGASLFFYCAKTSSAERNAGLNGFDAKWAPTMNGGIGGLPHDEDVATPKRNVHPTVKPIELMRWLIRLVTPPGGLILDPFTGSGTTGCAAVLEGAEFVGIEREPEYHAIAQARIGWWAEHPDGMRLVHRLEAEAERRERAKAGQLEMFG